MASCGLSTSFTSVARVGPTVRPGHSCVLISIAELNSVGRDAFASALKPLFEAATPLAEALYSERPFTSYVKLIDRAEHIAASLSDVEQVDVVNAHPRIGAAPARLSVLSFKEQGYAGSTSDDPRVMAALAALI